MIWIWLIAAVGFAVVEMAVPVFGFIFASAAALVAALTSTVMPGWEYQVMAFAVTLILMLVLIRPKLLKRFQGASDIPSRTESLIGKQGVISENVDPLLGTGRVTVEGQDWAAQSDEALAAGCGVRVEGADGIVLKVKSI